MGILGHKLPKYYGLCHASPSHGAAAGRGSQGREGEPGGPGCSCSWSGRGSSSWWEPSSYRVTPDGLHMAPRLTVGQHIFRAWTYPVYTPLCCTSILYTDANDTKKQWATTPGSCYSAPAVSGRRVDDNSLFYVSKRLPGDKLQIHNT